MRGLHLCINNIWFAAFVFSGCYSIHFVGKVKSSMASFPWGWELGAALPVLLAVLDTDSRKHSPSPINFLPYKKTGQLFLWPTSPKSYGAEFLEGESKEKNKTLALVSEQEYMQYLVW